MRIAKGERRILKSYVRWLASLAFAFLLTIEIGLGASGAALAQFAPQQKPPPGVDCQTGQECQVGPYTIRITFDRQTFNTTDEFLITVQRLNSPNTGWQLEAEVIPAARTSATTVKYDADRFLATNDPSQRQIKGYFPISGDWYLHLIISGPDGTGELHTAMHVAPPAKLPDWLAWAIGLSPLLGIAAFVIIQWRYVLRRKREEQVIAASAELQPPPPVPAEPVEKS